MSGVMTFQLSPVSRKALKSCGAYAIGTLGLKSLAHELDTCMEHHDPLLREAARQAKLRLAGAEASD